MADYNYQGIVAYTKTDKLDGMALQFLGQRIAGMQSHDLELDDPYGESFHDVNNEAARLEDLERFESVHILEDHTSIVNPDDCTLPEYTPELYKHAFVQRYAAKGQDFLKLYIPLTAKNEDVLDNVADNGVIPLLHALFGMQLVNIRRMKGSEHDAFEDLYTKNEVIYRAY